MISEDQEAFGSLLANSNRPALIAGRFQKSKYVLFYVLFVDL